QLWRLWQGIPGARFQTCWDQEVASTFWRGTSQRWGFNFDEVLVRQQVAGNAVDFRTQAHNASWFRTAQVQVAMLETDFFADFNVLINLEWQCCCGVQHGDFRSVELDVARGNIRILRPFGTRFDLSGNLQDVLVAQVIELGFIVHYDLCNTGGITQVDESYTTMVATASHPACHGHGLANVFGVEFAELMGAKHVVFPLLSSTC